MRTGYTKRGIKARHAPYPEDAAGTSFSGCDAAADTTADHRSKAGLRNEERETWRRRQARITTLPLVALHNASSQRTSERRRPVVQEEQKKKMLEYLERQRGTEGGRGGWGAACVCVSVFGPTKSCTHTRRMDQWLAQHTAAHGQKGVLIEPFACNTKTLQMCASSAKSDPL